MKKELIVFKDPKSPISEVLRTLRTNVQFMDAKKKSKIILITSAYSEEGKSWIASNLAVTFAQTGKKVLLIDADMRKGRQYSIFYISPIPGLSNYLSGINSNGNSNASENISDYIQETDIKNLHVISAGNIPPNPSELLNSTQMVNLLERTKEAYDIVIIDSTPTEIVTDALILARMVDSTILVTAYKKTKKEELKRVITNIQNIGGHISGVVLNRVPTSCKKYEEKYYYSSSVALKGTNKAKRYKTKTESNNNEDSQESAKDRVDTPLEKTDDILKQINEYFEQKKKTEK